ncbi:hypothetical protein AArc1_0542 [Natrarchaeobaculum sulfurireducens]|uniref:Uncharacterized protein n=1 Tax=Natrarchaeobaculum sulfurireducens TaxID=2044521 RepID=A0A346PBJ1_9EURY|nr:hypothetical protein AArc1_0542 [Natrarchaeobaculum sulfurireducens]
MSAPESHVRRETLSKRPFSSVSGTQQCVPPARPGAFSSVESPRPATDHRLGLERGRRSVCSRGRFDHTSRTAGRPNG